jgi:DNA polymerase I
MEQEIIQYYISERRNNPKYAGFYSANEDTGVKLMRSIEQERTKDEEIAIDIETNGLDAYENSPLLIGIYYRQRVIIIDATTINVPRLLNELSEDQITWITANGKFDAGFMKQHYDFNLIKQFDVMIASQKIYQGAGYDRQERSDGMKHNLVSIIEKYLGIGQANDKDVRSEFIGIEPSRFIATEKQLIYLVRDLVYLPAIKNRQEELLERYGIYYLDKVGKYIGWATALMELEGFDIPDELWLENVRKNEIKKHELACALDAEVRKLREFSKKKLYLTGGKFDRPRNKPEKTLYVDLFGQLVDAPTAKTKPKDSNINWKSSVQVEIIMGLLYLPLPVIEDRQVTVAIPTIATLNGKYKLEKRYKFTTNAGELEQMLQEFPNHKGAELIRLLIQYRETCTALSTFGEAFLAKKNKVSGRIHTSYRTDAADTGRFQSGDKRAGKPNFQNIPRDNAYRHCFYPKDRHKYNIVTSDLSGAEVTIMCDKSNDQQLYEWAVKNDDAHSPIATSCWRNVYLYRAGLEAEKWNNPYEFIEKGCFNHSDLIDFPNSYVRDNYQLSLTFIIDKKTNKEMRTDFKPITFGTVYGMFDAKLAKSLGITRDEAKVILWTIKNSIPATFAYVEAAAEQALTEGWLRINERSGQRILFPAAIERIKKGESIEMMPFYQKRNIEGSARNTTIQGTQADMLKEAIVEIQLSIYYNKWDFALINPVHDELNGRVPKNEEYKVMWYPDKTKVMWQPEEELFIPISRKFYKNFGVEGELVTPAEYIAKTMQEAANRYLTTFKMGVDFSVHETWTK